MNFLLPQKNPPNHYGQGDFRNLLKRRLKRDFPLRGQVLADMCNFF